jgi:hypothetical protein
MGAPKPYNGHHCWNCWNVALWIGNDEGLYLAAMEYVNRVRRGRIDRYGKPRSVTYTQAARGFIDHYGLNRTPDGAVYSVRAVTSALKGLAEE